MKKRVLSLLLAAVMVTALLPMSALAAESDFVIEDGALTKYNGSGGDVVIPDGVTRIGNGAFKDCATVTSVTISNGVTEIGFGVFQNCANLTSVTIPDSVTSINDYAFYGCKNLVSVYIPDGVSFSTAPNAFGGCTNLATISAPADISFPMVFDREGKLYVLSPTAKIIWRGHRFSVKDGCLQSYRGEGGNVVIPDGVTKIERSAFQNCTSLTSVTIPEGVTDLYPLAFAECTSLTSVTIPASMDSIAWGAFDHCYNLRQVHYGGSEAQWDDVHINRDRNSDFLLASVDYAAQPVQTSAATAYASTQTVQVDGKSVTFNAYALKDANGNDTNYIKLRDVADVLSGSAAQFQVGWDGSIAITTGQMYTPNGTENIQNFTGDQTYTVSTSPVTINGVTVDLEAITLTDASGGGYTYFKLRDLGEALGFDVSWSAETGITIDPNSPYNANS